MANIELYEELKRRKPLMCEALRILMKPELDESMEKGMDLILEIKNGSTDEELVQLGYTPEAIKNAKEKIKLILT